MSKYRGDKSAVAALVRETEVHRDLYIDPELFELEMEHLFVNTWVYVGHDSQVPNVGDYVSTTIGTQPVMMVRRGDGVVRVFTIAVRTKARGSTDESCGNTGRFFRCPYHAWSFRTDGSLAAVPLRAGYENTGFEEASRRAGMAPVRTSTIIAASSSPSLARSDSASRSSSASSTIEPRQHDRSLAGRDNSKSRAACCATCTTAIGRCWWRTRPTPCHPMIAHESSAGTAVAVWKRASRQSKADGGRDLRAFHELL